MSRSYRKPYITQESSAKKFFKKAYNQSVRRQEEIPDGNAYRKMYSSYNITDYRFYEPNDRKARRK